MENEANEKPDRTRNGDRERNNRRDNDRERRPRARPALDPQEQERREKLRESDKYKTAESLSSRFAREKASSSDGEIPEKPSKEKEAAKKSK